MSDTGDNSDLIKAAPYIFLIVVVIAACWFCGTGLPNLVRYGTLDPTKTAQEAATRASEASEIKSLQFLGLRSPLPDTGKDGYGADVFCNFVVRNVGNQPYDFFWEIEWNLDYPNNPGGFDVAGGAD